MASEQTELASEEIRQIPGGIETLLIEVHFPGLRPDEVFAAFTRQEMLQQWWPPEAEVKPGMDGSYHLWWPGPDWHLRGRYTVWEPDKRLVFSWKWDHDEEGTPERTVAVDLAPLDGKGCRMRLEHGPYSDSGEEQEARAGHVEGWSYFLPRLSVTASGR